MPGEKATGVVSSIFISYRRSDSGDVTGRIRDRLCAHFGDAAVFVDVHNTPLGIDFRVHIDKTISQCGAFLAVIGASWLAADAQGRRRLDDPGDVLRIEVESALKLDIPVIPLLVHGARMPSADELPDSLKALARRNGTLVRPDPDFRHDMDRLIASLEQRVGLRASAPAHPSVASRPPVPDSRSEPQSRARRTSASRTMTRLLMLSVLVQMAVFLTTGSNDIRLISMFAGTLLGVGTIVTGTMRHSVAETALGVVGVAPWVLLVVVPPLLAALAPAIAVLVLGALVSKSLRRPEADSIGS